MSSHARSNDPVSNPYIAGMSIHSGLVPDSLHREKAGELISCCLCQVPDFIAKTTESQLMLQRSSVLLVLRSIRGTASRLCSTSPSPQFPSSVAARSPRYWDGPTVIQKSKIFSLFQCSYQALCPLRTVAELNIANIIGGEAFTTVQWGGRKGEEIETGIERSKLHAGKSQMRT